jgi:hypothetical protein
MQIHSVGIDLGKMTFHLVALGAAGKVLKLSHEVCTGQQGRKNSHNGVSPTC